MRSIPAVFLLLLVTIAIISGSPLGPSSASGFPQTDQSSGNSLVYADFEKTENGRLVSNGGGQIQIYGSQETTPVQFKGLANASPGAPDIVRLKPDDPNHLASFEYNLTSPNQWANVTLQIDGHAAKDGKPVADDVSGYKNLSIQLYVTGVDYIRVEFVSHGQGINISNAFPQTSVKIRPGLNTYVIPLKSTSQPSWASDHIDTKEVLKRLTSVSISAFCDQCLPQHGMVLIDNLVFQK
jgi:hypothetical protein